MPASDACLPHGVYTSLLHAYSVTIVATYILLNAENHQWPWLSFLASASTSIYVFLYSIFFFFIKTGCVGPTLRRLLLL